MEGIAVAFITGGLALLGTIIASRSTVNKVNQTVMQNLSVSQAVTDAKIDELTREVREHNNFAHRVPVVEEQISDLKRRVGDLEDLQR